MGHVLALSVLRRAVVEVQPEAITPERGAVPVRTNGVFDRIKVHERRYCVKAPCR